MSSDKGFFLIHLLPIKSILPFTMSTSRFFVLINLTMSSINHGKAATQPLPPLRKNTYQDGDGSGNDDTLPHPEHQPCNHPQHIAACSPSPFLRKPVYKQGQAQ